MVRLLGAVLAIVFGANSGRAATVPSRRLRAPRLRPSPRARSINIRSPYSTRTLLDTVAITGSTLPAWLTLTDNGNRTATLTGTPSAANVGPNPVTLVASDGVNSAQQSFTITVTAVNDPPAFTSTAPTAATEGVLYTYTATATDPDGDTLTFAAPTRPAWLTLSGATLSGTPGQANVGTHNVTITVSDGTAPAGRAIVPNRRRQRERSAGLHEHRADGGDPRRGLHLYRNGHRSRRQHADICSADASGVAHAVRCDALGHSGSSQRRHAQRHDHGVGWHRVCGRAIVPNRRRGRERSAGLSRAPRRRPRPKACSTPTPRPPPIPTATR